MELVCKKSDISGEILVPGSKSQVVRALVIATLAKGTSRIINPLLSDDSSACIAGCRAFGADVLEKESLIVVNGVSGKPRTPNADVYLGNSGISNTFLAGLAAHAKGPSVLTGGESLRSRPFAPLCDGINDLGGKAESFEDTGRPPLIVSGYLSGGFTEIDGVNSQPVSSLIVNSALAREDTEISVINPSETPYVEMTLKWLSEQGIKYKASKDFSSYKVRGEQEYKSFEKVIPADWSSACFSLCAAAITPSSEVLVKGLDFNDAQGDKEIINILKKMGAEITVLPEGVRVVSANLQGTEIDLSKTPDAFPILSVVGCFAEGETRLVNVAHARIKETDRIKSMSEGLRKMGAVIEELPDGLVVRKSKLHGANLNGYNDHRTIMSLAVAGINAEGETKISTAEGINKTYPSFVTSMKKLGAQMEVI
ncbi:3-phosphoshikimate 1-carboxyvinyltransferase [uncultured archaeon]|nr:3-phosphoshikimate 1-carboxyvinyltransferase [uncultured archaeon]